MVGNTIREARLKLGLGQREVAERIGISVAYLSQIELNQRRPAGFRLSDFAHVLHVDYDYLCYLLGHLPGDLCDHDVTPEEVSKAFHVMRWELLGDIS